LLTTTSPLRKIMLDMCVLHEITTAKRQGGFKNSLPTTPPLLSYQTSARRAKVAGKMQKAESFASRALAAKNARKEKEKEITRTQEERKSQQMEDAKNALLCGVGAQTRAKATSKEQAQQKEREMEKKKQLEKNVEQARLQEGKEIEQLIEQTETLEMQASMTAIGNLDMNKCRGAMVVQKKLPNKEIEFNLAAAAVQANKDKGIELNAFDIDAEESGKHVALVIRTEKDEQNL